MAPISFSHLLFSLLIACLVTTPLVRLGHAKEVEVTKDWQLLGENDTIPAGMHVRMDMTTGEKWVKLPDDNDKSQDDSSLAVVVDPDGQVQEATKDSNKNSKNNGAGYDYEMMHRTLSKLPDEEMDRYGGLPQLPSGENVAKLTPEERKLFEERMAKIWTQRQAELKAAQEQLLDIPEVLKERIRGIKEYLKDPMNHLNSFKLEDADDEDKGMVTHILSLMKDLEFQLSDLDNARDFHTMGGWGLLVLMASEEAHVQNKTISKVSRSTEAKIRALQAHAFLAIGTVVKNTEEFHTYAIEPVHVGANKMTAALDMAIDVFCKDYKEEESWPIRTLQAKSIYAIGSLLRGNRLSQARLVESQGAARLSSKLQYLVQVSEDMKLVQRLMSLASDLISEIQLDGDPATPDLNDSIIQAFTTPEWCQLVSSVLTTETVLPVRVQESAMETSLSMAPYCTSWKESSEHHKDAVRRFWSSWEENENDMDIEHSNQLKKMATQLRKLL